MYRELLSRNKTLYKGNVIRESDGAKRKQNSQCITGRYKVKRYTEDLVARAQNCTYC